MKNKEFDCVEFQDRAGERIYEQIKGMTVQEQLEFWRKQTKKLRQQQQAARDRIAKRPSARPRAGARSRRVSPK